MGLLSLADDTLHSTSYQYSTPQNSQNSYIYTHMSKFLIITKTSETNSVKSYKAPNHKSHHSGSVLIWTQLIRKSEGGGLGERCSDC